MRAKGHPFTIASFATTDAKTQAYAAGTGPSFCLPPQQPSRQIGADCSTGPSNVPVVPGSKGDRDGDGIAYEK